MNKHKITAWTDVIIAAIFFFYWFIQLSLSNMLIKEPNNYHHPHKITGEKYAT
ncbi:hypothetical protein [Facilibium subflavum]|uniref:hypothetical protein n=1 Tax=Facilibium subflavum TaxID=2219058 RepID=UPI0013C2B906|nr:hypothetical protein [Facilibium subflavum]